MTDPVDTDALREIAAGFDAKGWVNNAQHCRAAADEVDRLRAVVENAPHGDTCNCSTHRIEGAAQTVDCTCWKAGVL